MKIRGYSKEQLETMLRQQRKSLTQESVTLRREINRMEKRLAEIAEKLEEVERSEQMLYNW